MERPVSLISCALMSSGHTFQRLNKNKDFVHVPNEKTVLCPLDVQDLVQSEENRNGMDTMWIVENTSSEPIVLSFVGRDGVEYSASNSKITPPQDDPRAFLKPKQWKALHAWEGHVFHVRSFDSETGTLGPVLLQHRVGLIPVGARAQDLQCPLDDPEPLKDKAQRDPNFKRTPPRVNRRCNTMDVGFRNMANCPLNAYYIHKDSNQTTCREEFKFHLGMNPLPGDFMWQWDSRTKFEQTFVGHSFAFRSAADPSILVDTVTLQPTRVTDCPLLKQQAQVNKVTSVGEMEQVFLPLSVDGEVSKQDQLLDTLARMERNVVENVFNVSYGLNTTAANGNRSRSRPLRHGARLYHHHAINSF